MKESYQHWLPNLINVKGIVLFKKIYYAESRENVSGRLRRHEMAHVRQQRREGILRFKLNYLVEYLQNLWKYRNKWKFSFKNIKKYLADLHQIAYWNISYEIEAVEAEFSNVKK